MKHWDIWDTRMQIRAATVDGSMSEAIRLARSKNQVSREPGRYIVAPGQEVPEWGRAVLAVGPL